MALFVVDADSRGADEHADPKAHSSQRGSQLNIDSCKGGLVTVLDKPRGFPFDRQIDDLTDEDILCQDDAVAEAPP